MYILKFVVKLFLLYVLVLEINIVNYKKLDNMNRL